ncbi:hypothetical protein LCGC14_0693610 [marine sediment metagenome]|uniref:site-specific DNA-methyltransferase (cytosine-N(4)-specific) n=1 Tax=marine sediment metagenome TaxID=412755 RepID=A0A0F9QJU3_9ZZZZ
MLLQSDVFHIPLRDRSVHCVMTSPPYLGLRKYAGEQGEEPLGLESTLERHVERTVEWAREIKRVLRDDGVFWLNYGDCYGGSWGNYGSREGGQRGVATNQLDRKAWDNNTERPVASRFPQGSLMMVPHRVALALQADGWIVRQDLVWFKRNPMPESVAGTRWVKHRIKVGKKYQDCLGCEKCNPNDGLVLKRGSWRHTRAHEYVFMLTKKMQYWSNQEAVRENANTEGDSRFERTDNTQTFGRDGEDSRKRTGNPTSGRNPRDVLDIPAAPYKGAHYATFPPALIAPLIRATCPQWACPVCGQGWAAVVEHDNPNKLPVGGKLEAHLEMGTRNDGNMGMGDPTNSVLGYRPTCEHPHTQEEAVPGIVLDPFMGSGTTGQVATFFGNRWIGLDLSREYLREQAAIRVLEPIKGKSLERIKRLKVYQKDEK